MTPEAGTISYEYWDNDLVKKVTDARGISRQFTYNNRNLLTDLDYSDSTPDVHYAYGEYGERTLMEEKNGTTVIGSIVYSYDSFKRLQSETRQFDGLTGDFSVSYAYNKVDALTQVTYTVNAWTKSVNYDYNYAGALTKVGTNLNPLPGVSDNVMKNLNYRAFGALKSGDYGNGRRIELGYNPQRLNLASLKVFRPSPAESIIDYSYDYYLGGSNNGRLQKITDNLDTNYTTTYGYDVYNRLASATAGAFTRSYSYEPWGNLTAVSGTGGEAPNYTLSYATNASGAPLNNRINNTGYIYDAAGNPTSAEGWNYTYDAASRLASVNGSSVTYGYDGDGRRVKNQVSPNPAGYYLWSSVLGQPVVEIQGGTGSVGRAYVYSPGGQLLAEQSYDGGFYWVHTDHLGSARKLTDTSGNVVYRGEYDPHGQMVFEWAQGGQTFLNSHKFTGYERDAATQLENANARMYARVKGRFLQPDPMGLGAADMTNPQSLNLYSYVGNDPVKFTDPEGLFLYNPPAPEIGGSIDPGQCYALYIDGIYAGTIDNCGGGGGGGGGDSGGGGGGGDGGGGGQEQNLLHEALHAQKDNCTIQFYDRLIETVHGIPIPGARHGYIDFTESDGTQHYFEGYRDTSQKPTTLTAVESNPQRPPIALKSDIPAKNHLAGQTSGPEVCGWLDTLKQAASTVNAANIKYSFLGPNSTSALRYMLQSLPDNSWFRRRFMIGWGARLPGVEP